MRISSCLTLLVLPPLFAVACHGSETTAPGDDGGPRPVAMDSSPPHVFKPRPHPPRQHPIVPPPPDPSTLPRLVDRTALCFGGIEDKPASVGGIVRGPATNKRNGKNDSRPRPKQSPAQSGSGRGTGYVPYGGGGGGESPAKKGSGGQTSTGTKSAAGAAKPPSRPPTTDAYDGGAARPTSAPPSSAPAPEYEARRKDDRGAKSEESKRRRARDETSQAEVSSEAAHGPVSHEKPIAPDSGAGYHDWGAAIYLSNDDTMSLSSAQRVLFAIDNFLELPPEHIRPHELLNYFSFDTAPVKEGDDFSVVASIAPDENQLGIYNLALAVRGRPLGREGRRNANLAFSVDRSGSMSAEGRMEYLKRGLLRSIDELKTGDIVHLVLFDHEVCTPIENFVVGRDPRALLEKAISRLEPRGSTDLHSGLRTAYELADRTYQPAYSSRVVLITDALANTGVTDSEMISMISRYYDSRRIRLSGVGVGREFNDGLLDRLTERGKGAYVFLGSQAEVDAVFGARFTSLIETTANDVHFLLHLPPSLRMNVFYGEESSVVKEDVQAIHYFANTSQLFLSDLMARGGEIRPQDYIMLTVEYEHPETGTDMIEEYAFGIHEILGRSRNIEKSRLVMRFIDGLAWMSTRPPPAAHGRHAGSWQDEGAWRECELGREDLSRMASGMEDDPEVRRVVALWDKYCARYERPRHPVVRDTPAPDAWPGARG